VRCISVYTKNFEVFSDIYEEILNTPLEENEEKTVQDIVFSDSGEIDDEYINRLKIKPEVVVMKEKSRDIMILQHGEVFEIFIPSAQVVVN
jgi:DNA-binding transcriptional regulator/RsmH inhibitor MraZ